MKRQILAAIACGVVPMVVTHFAYWLNIRAGVSLDAQFICNPYLEGCVSTSRAVRSGPGLLWFKAVMLPMALVLALTWRDAGRWMSERGGELPNLRRWMVWLGIGGAIALVFYVVYLGTEGPIYAWLRRYGVVFFFGFTALAQLLAARIMAAVFGVAGFGVAGFGAGVFGRGRQGSAMAFIGIVSLQWAIGVFSVLKRFIFTDPEVIDRIENITEWFMILTMSVGFVLLGLLLRYSKTATPKPS